jgi:hypothetical protein
MCPDPALLVGYRDGTLFSRDVIAVERHVAGCAECAAVLAALRREREAGHRSPRLSPRTIGAAVAGIAILALGAWLMLPGSRDASPREMAPAPTAPVSPAAVVERPAAPAPAAPAPAAAPVASTTSRSRPAVTPGPNRTAAKPLRAAPAVESVAVAPVEDPIPAPVDAGVILRGRRAARRTLWRVRDQVIEHSTDGGATWAAEHTADRPVRAGALVNADIAWLVGENGLVLRRTKNGWFGATPPSDGTITAVRASSSSKATVTLEDGRSFTTENGGATWSAQ